MKCAGCTFPVKGSDLPGRVEVREGKTFGDGVPGAVGPLSEARGQLVAVYHKKCWWRARKAAQRGGSVTGGQVRAYDGE